MGSLKIMRKRCGVATTGDRTYIVGLGKKGKWAIVRILFLRAHLLGNYSGSENYKYCQCWTHVFLHNTAKHGSLLKMPKDKVKMSCDVKYPKAPHQ